MDKSEFEAMVNAALENDCVEVTVVASEAGDNAADTVGRNFNEAFIKAWIDSAASLLSTKEYAPAREFFAAYGVVA